MFTNIYLVECILRNTRTMENSQQSKLMRQKAFENLNDAMYYYFLMQDALVENGYEFVVSPDVNYNADSFGKKVLPTCDLRKGFRYFKIRVKLIPLMKEV